MDINFCIHFGFMYNLLIAKCKQSLNTISFIGFCYMPTFAIHLLILIIFNFFTTTIPTPDPFTDFS